MQKDSEMRIVLRNEDKNISRIFHIERIVQITASFCNATLLQRKKISECLRYDKNNNVMLSCEAMLSNEKQDCC